MGSGGFGLGFDHLGLATRDPDATLKFLRGLGYDTPASVHDPLQSANLVYCTHEAMPAVEVIYAGDDPGPLDAILSAKPTDIYHQCYRSADRLHTLSAIKAAGHRVVLVSAPKPAILFGGLSVSFHLVKGFGLIEIIEDPSAASSFVQP